MELQARKPWSLACQALDKFNSLHSPGEFPDWQIYWIAGVATLRATGNVLQSVDAKRDEKLGAIIADHWAHSGMRDAPIFKEFLKTERDGFLKEFVTGVELTPVAFTKLFGEPAGIPPAVELTWKEDGDDALRLYEIALLDFHEDLSIIEQAYEEGVAKPFSENRALRHDLLERSEAYFQRLPKTVRL